MERRTPEQMAERLAQDIPDGSYVNLGIGMPVMVANFVPEGREVIYYVRAIQEPTMAVNAGGLRCERDEAGRCIKVRPCHGDYRTPADDECMAEVEERAWSSPIFVTPPRGAKS